MMSWPGAICGGNESAVGAAVASGAPPTSDRDIPTTPNAGTVSFRPFCVERCLVCRILEPPYPVVNVRRPPTLRTPCAYGWQPSIETVEAETMAPVECGGSMRIYAWSSSIRCRCACSKSENNLKARRDQSSSQRLRSLRSDRKGQSWPIYKAILLGTS